MYKNNYHQLYHLAHFHSYRPTEKNTSPAHLAFLHNNTSMSRLFGTFPLLGVTTSASSISMAPNCHCRASASMTDSLVMLGAFFPAHSKWSLVHLEEVHGIGTGRVGVEGHPPPWPHRRPSERRHNPMDSLVVLVTFSPVHTQITRILAYLALVVCSLDSEACQHLPGSKLGNVGVEEEATGGGEAGREASG